MSCVGYVSCVSSLFCCHLLLFCFVCLFVCLFVAAWPGLVSFRLAWIEWFVVYVGFLPFDLFVLLYFPAWVCLVSWCVGLCCPVLGWVLS